MVPYKCYCFSAKSIQEWIQGGRKRRQTLKKRKTFKMFCHMHYRLVRKLLILFLIDFMILNGNHLSALWGNCRCWVELGRDDMLKKSKTLLISHRVEASWDDCDIFKFWSIFNETSSNMQEQTLPMLQLDDLGKDLAQGPWSSSVRICEGFYHLLWLFFVEIMSVLR